MLYLNVFADDDPTYAALEVPENDYISPNNYFQNPYNGQLSLGGTKHVTESSIANDSFMRTLMTDGTYNVDAFLTGSPVNSQFNYAYGANVFAQTGHVGGFALGGVLQVINPLSSNTTPTTLRYQNLPVNNIVGPSEAYVEYQYAHMVQVDAGAIAINVPWIQSFDPVYMGSMTFEGALVNVQPLKSLWITALGFNNTRAFSQTGFSNHTLYDYNNDFNTSTSNVTNASTPGAYALGIGYEPTANYNIHFWGYQFLNYVNMGYMDTQYTEHFTNTFKMDFAGQIAAENPNGSNIINQPTANGSNSNGSPSSLIAGGKINATWDIWSLMVGFNTVGGSGSYGQGGFVSPYTYQAVSDPLYTTSWLAGMVEEGSSGNAYKLAPSVSLLGVPLDML